MVGAAKRHGKTLGDRAFSGKNSVPGNTRVCGLGKATAIWSFRHCQPAACNLGLPGASIRLSVPYHIIPYHTIPYYTILYYSILYYAILYYTIWYLGRAPGGRHGSCSHGSRQWRAGGSSAPSRGGGTEGRQNSRSGSLEVSELEMLCLLKFDSRRDSLDYGKISKLRCYVS